MDSFDQTPSPPAVAPAGRLLLLPLLALLVAGFAAPLALSAWSVLPAGWPIALAGAVLSCLVLAPVLWLVQRPVAEPVWWPVPDLSRVAENTGNLVIVTDAQWRIVWTNQAFTRTSGYELHEIVGQMPGPLLHGPRTDRAAVDRLRAALDAGQGLRIELLNRSKDGRDYWVDADVQPLRDAGGVLTGFAAVMTEVSEQVGQRVRRSTLLGALPVGLVVHDNDGRLLQANPSARAMLGLSSDELPERLDGIAAVHQDLSEFSDSELPMQQTLRTGQAVRSQVMGVTGVDGERRWLLVNTQPVFDALGRRDGAVACYVDMTDRRRPTQTLRHSPRSDALTRLPQRTELVETLQRAIEHRKSHPDYGFAALLVDIDRFAQVNQSLGHAAGDELLNQMATRLLQTLRPGDVVARVPSALDIGGRRPGDEFVVVLDGAPAVNDIRVVADRLLAALTRTWSIGAHEVAVGVSIGVVTAERAARSAEQVLVDCDTAMYEAKRSGRGCCVFFDPAMRDQVERAQALEGDLRRALQQGELFLQYQPVLELASHRLMAVEALLRWQHPTRGVLAAADFLDAADECGLVAALGDHALAAACGQFARWRRELGAGAPPKVSVNLAPSQLRVPGMVAEIEALLADHDMRAAELQIEVADGAALHELAIQVALQGLKGLGVGLALDDFGKGASSLASLRQLQVDTVKIDPSFVADAAAQEHHRVLIESTIRVARQLGVTVVAEGIETAEQAALMTRLDCDQGQGFLLGEPLSAGDLAHWEAPPLALVAA